MSKAIQALNKENSINFKLKQVNKDFYAYCKHNMVSDLAITISNEMNFKGRDHIETFINQNREGVREIALKNDLDGYIDIELLKADLYIILDLKDSFIPYSIENLEGFLNRDNYDKDYKDSILKTKVNTKEYMFLRNLFANDGILSYNETLFSIADDCLLQEIAIMGDTIYLNVYDNIDKAFKAIEYESIREFLDNYGHLVSSNVYLPSE